MEGFFWSHCKDLILPFLSYKVHRRTNGAKKWACVLREATKALVAVSIFFQSEKCNSRLDKRTHSFNFPLVVNKSTKDGQVYWKSMAARWVSLDQKGQLRPHEVIWVVKKRFSMTYLMCSFCIFIFGGIIVYQMNGPLKNVISKKHTILFDQNTYHLSCRWRSESGLLLTVRNAQIRRISVA